MEGWLEKEGHWFKNWKKRYFVLDGNGSLAYYTDDTRGKIKGSYQLSSTSSVNSIKEQGSRRFRFVVRAHGANGSDVLVLSAGTDTDRELWMSKLEQAHEKHGSASNFDF